MPWKGFPSFLLLKKKSSTVLFTNTSHKKPAGLASLVLHEGLLEAKIPPHHRLSLHRLIC